MGQQQSAEKPASARSVTPQSGKDKDKDKEHKVNRRVSLQALSHPRATPADPSASNANAVAQVTTTHNVEKSNLQHMLESTSPEPSAHKTRQMAADASAARAMRQRKEIEQNMPAPAPLPQPVAVPQALPSTNIDIPASSVVNKTRSEETAEDYLAYQDRHYGPISHTRPPRLPLAIVDSRVPDSPTLMPLDQGIADVPIFDPDEPMSVIDLPPRRRSSFQSEATQEEEEIGDELQPYAIDPPAQVVPTLIEWNQPGERVFVTGTFATWERKYRLHKRKDRDGMACTISLPPGTHHLKFWVDNQMVTSPDLPTAVDFNNVLVNYIEINADDVPRSRRESNQTANQKATGYLAQPGTVTEDQEESISGAATPGEEPVGMDDIGLKEMPIGDYRNIIPQYLLDIDHPEDDPKYRQAAEIIQDGNGPPSLPMFLNRSILNGNTPVKDDGSVLTLPNHTVLNHLMTSSVKNGVLATSVTTRYNRKYVTTISFKPVPTSDARQARR